LRWPALDIERGSGQPLAVRSGAGTRLGRSGWLKALQIGDRTLLTLRLLSLRSQTETKAGSSRGSCLLSSSARSTSTTARTSSSCAHDRTLTFRPSKAHYTALGEPDEAPASPLGLSPLPAAVRDPPIWHSCGRFSLAVHFRGKDRVVRQVFNRLRALLRECGPVEVIPQKTRIVFLARMRFASVMPRTRWLDGGLILARKVTDPRFHRIETYGPYSYVHRFRLRDLAELDRAFEALVREAYVRARQEHLGPDR